MARYVLGTANTGAGGDYNVALTTFHVPSPLDPQQVAMQLVAFAQYMLPAADSYVTSVEFSATDAPGPLTPIDWAQSKYDALRADDTALVAMTGYRGPYGSGVLTVLGAGGVLDKRTALPGRQGRGRLTTPWLNQDAVSAYGALIFSSQGVLVTGWNLYLRGGNAGGVDLHPYVFNKSSSVVPITHVTASARLGRLRSRSN